MIGLKFRGMPAIDFAKTVLSVANLKNEYAQTIMNRNNTIDEDLVGSVIAQGIMSYAGRNPSPALDQDGNFQCTDLDLLSFLSPIAARGAVIEIPRYRNRRQVIKREGERKIGSNQFGPILSLVSNKDVFSFSIKIHDKTIVVKDPETGRESIGDFRNYMIVDCDGFWYDGWNKIVWDPDAEENAFLRDNKLWTGNSVYFQYYVHPNRWQSVFGAPYLLKKMLISRLDDEAGFYRKEMERLEALGIELPKGEMKPSRPIIAAGNTEAISVKTMEMVLAIPDFSGNYQSVPATQAGLIQAYERQKLLTYTWKPAVQFVVRADEAAYMFNGLDKNDNGKVAQWMGNAAWTPFKKTPRSALFNQIVLSDDMALLYRTKMKTERINAD
jgi:hypothetical protein